MISFHLEQGEKLKRQASDTSDKVKAAAKDAKKQVEKQTNGFGDKLYNVLIDVKNSILGKFVYRKVRFDYLSISFLETIGLAAKTATEAGEQAKAKINEASGKAKKAADKAKKKVKETIDL